MRPRISVKERAETFSIATGGKTIDKCLEHAMHWLQGFSIMIDSLSGDGAPVATNPPGVGAYRAGREA